MKSLYSRIAFWLLAVTAISVSFYPILYFVIDRTFGLLGGKPPELLTQLPYNIGFYAHICFGAVALLVGWTQFHEGWRRRYMMAHRVLGKVYMLSVLISGAGSLYIVTHGSGGLVAQTGFFFLAIVWLSTSVLAYRAIRVGDVSKHQRMMVYSYAVCFSAVMLRLWLPLFTSIFEWEFTPSYRIIAWLCWLPNMAVAYFINSRT